jgi:crotonobetainyl-CoA:carnitine CoA-transferase CaiB-like acyl-CoA transferase
MKERISTNRPACEGLRIIDLTIALAGPMVTSILAQLGAEVIKVERPRTGDVSRRNTPYFGSGGIHFHEPSGDDMSIAFAKRNRLKKSITLNLKTGEGREILLKLANKSDVLVENFSAGTMGGLDLGYDVVSEINPRIVFCSVSGFGQSGPYKDFSAMDQIIQAMSGIMSVTGFQDGPPLRSGIPLGDLIGPLYAVIGILAALRAREATGRGQRIDLSLLDSLVSLVLQEPFDIYVKEGRPVRYGNSMPRLAPFKTYETKDGYVAICAPYDHFVAQLFEAMENPHLIRNPEFNSRERRAENYVHLDELIQTWTKTRETNDVVTELRRRDVPCGPLLGIPEIVNDPHLRARRAVVPLSHPFLGDVVEIAAPSLPIIFSQIDGPLSKPAPRLGEHNYEILSGLLGMSSNKINLLKEREII